LLALIADRLAAANWQRSGKGPRPRPVMRPGERPARFGDAAMSIDELDQLLPGKRARRPDGD
jgi:hypothetical protein